MGEGLQNTSVCDSETPANNEKCIFVTQTHEIKQNLE